MCLLQRVVRPMTRLEKTCHRLVPQPCGCATLSPQASGKGIVEHAHKTLALPPLQCFKNIAMTFFGRRSCELTPSMVCHCRLVSNRTPLGENGRLFLSLPRPGVCRGYLETGTLFPFCWAIVCCQTPQNTTLQRPLAPRWLLSVHTTMPHSGPHSVEIWTQLNRTSCPLVHPQTLQRLGHWLVLHDLAWAPFAGEVGAVHFASCASERVSMSTCGYCRPIWTHPSQSTKTRTWHARLTQRKL